jgi:hypothetical protein
MQVFALWLAGAAECTAGRRYGPFQSCTGLQLTASCSTGTPEGFVMDHLTQSRCGMPCDLETSNTVYTFCGAVAGCLLTVVILV